jgi:hypothetical protein
MTKTFAKIAACRDVISGEPGMMPLSATADGSFCLNFLNLGHWDLFGIWDLMLGILTGSFL